MKQMIVMFVLLGAGVMEGQTAKPVALAEGVSLSAPQIETAALPELLLCCGGPMCIPGEPCGTALVLVGQGFIGRQASESVQNAGILRSSSRAAVEGNSVGKLLWCCGGPMCIPNEPCGPGEQNRTS